MKNKIKKYLPKEVLVISEDEIVGKKLKDYLSRHQELEKVLSVSGKRTFYSTDITDKFETLGSKFFGQKIKVKKAKLI